MNASPVRASLPGARRAVTLLACVACACSAAGVDAGRPAPDESPGGDSATVRFTIDPGRRFAISPFIYGINGYGRMAEGGAVPWPRGVTLSRFGGNRLTAYNWQNNASNAGNDYDYQNDDYLGGGTTPGEAVRVRVAGALARRAGIIVTVPMIGYVARDVDRTTVGTDPATLRARLAGRFVPSLPSRGPSASPPPVADTIYQDEFVRWLTRAFPTLARNDSTPLFFCLDNEPDLWGSTHEEIMPKVPVRARRAASPASMRQRVGSLARAARQLVRGGETPTTTAATLTYDDLIDRTIVYAQAIKAVAPRALVFGPGVATWAGAATLGRWPDPDPRYGTRFFLDVYLERLRDAERTTGQRLIDVLDIHWYPAARAEGGEIGDDMAPQTPEMIEARLQAPRSLWDSTYDERSWVSGVQGGPIRLLPLLREKVAAHYPGTRLAITEYYYGRGGDISGGIAQADVLGIFGREGLFAATLWPNAKLEAVPYGGSAERAYQYVIGAFRMYRDYDGRGGAFGPVGLAAATSDPAGSSVYASAEDASASQLVIVAINKRRGARTAVVDVATSPHGWNVAEVYSLVDGSPQPTRRPDLPMQGARVLRYEMPPLSVSTLVLRR